MPEKANTSCSATFALVLFHVIAEAPNAHTTASLSGCTQPSCASTNSYQIESQVCSRLDPVHEPLFLRQDRLQSGIFRVVGVLSRGSVDPAARNRLSNLY